MTQRLILLFSIVLILAATAALAYTYPAERTVLHDLPQKDAKFTEWKGKAIQLFRDDNRVRCELVLKRILRADPGDLDALHLLAQLRLKSGNAEASERIFRQILRSVPDDAEAHNNLGILFFKRGSVIESLRELFVASALMPDDAVIRYNLETARNQLGSNGTFQLLPRPAERYPLLMMEDRY